MKTSHLPLYRFRCWLLEKLYEVSVWFYTIVFKRKTTAWDVSIGDLEKYPKNSLGKELAVFLKRNGFSIQQKLESHDVFHILTDTGVEVPDEISMQFLLFANGKRSVYGVFTASIGSLLIPEYFALYRKQYRKGKSLRTFHHWDFKSLLPRPLSSLQQQMNLV